MYPSGWIGVSPSPNKLFRYALSSFSSRPSLSKAVLNRMSAELPWSTSVRWRLALANTIVITMGSSCPEMTPAASSLVKVIVGRSAASSPPWTWYTSLRCLL
ncbi:uncharacterized protein DS421_9g265710 [Arachis hypogaea]|nr:uncharacterized protein DS421_9g265710 [Arachis hypogaea]